MAFPATHTGTCQRCKGAISPGDPINIRNRPFTGARFHETCPGATAGETSTPETSTPDAPDAPEATPETPEAPPAASAPAGSIDAAIDARIEARIGKGPAVNEATIRRIVKEESTRTIQITLTRPDGTSATIPDAHYLMPRLLNLLGAGISVYLYGPAGTGKTTALLTASTALGHGGEIDTLDPSTPKSGVMGYRTPTGEPVETAFTRCYGRGGMYIADEADNAPAHVQTLFNSALANGHAPAAWGQIARSDAFAFGACGNTPFRPTPKYPDRKVGSAAFTDRLYYIFWPLDPNIERRATGRPAVKAPGRTGAVREITPAAWGRWVEEVRAWADKAAPTLQVTPRATIIGLKALAAGETPEEVAHGLVFRGADAAMVSKALEACPLPE